MSQRHAEQALHRHHGVSTYVVVQRGAFPTSSSARSVRVRSAVLSERRSAARRRTSVDRLHRLVARAERPLSFLVMCAHWLWLGPLPSPAGAPTSSSRFAVRPDSRTHFFMIYLFSARSAWAVPSAARAPPRPPERSGRS